MKQLSCNASETTSPLTIAVCFLLTLVPSQAVAPTNLAGTWIFTHMNGRFEGTIVLRQKGTDLSGTWHTSKGKSESDTSVIGRIDGMTVVLTRFIADSQQNYILHLSADGNFLDGFGEGWFIKHADLKMRRAGAGAAYSRSFPSSASSASGTPTTAQKSAASTATPGKKQTWMGIGLPPPRGTYSWTIQSVAVGSGFPKKYSSFYYEVATGRSVDEPLSLPRGGEIVGVFPDDCAFSVQDRAGHSFRFRNEEEAKAKGFGPGTWSVYPLKCGGIAVYVK